MGSFCVIDLTPPVETCLPSPKVIEIVGFDVVVFKSPMVAFFFALGSVDDTELNGVHRYLAASTK